MDPTDFDYQFYTEVPNLDGAFASKAEAELRALAEGHKDVTGAHISLRQPAHDDTPFVYEARVTVFVRPENIVTVEQGATAEGTLNGAVKNAIRKVREKRERLGQPWKRVQEE